MSPISPEVSRRSERRATTKPHRISPGPRRTGPVPCFIAGMLRRWRWPDASRKHDQYLNGRKVNQAGRSAFSLSSAPRRRLSTSSWKARVSWGCLNSRFEPWPRRKPRLRASPIIPSLVRIAEEQFGAVGRRFAFDFLEQGRADAKMLPVIGNRHAEFAGAFRARKRHPRLPIGADRDPANEESERLNDGSFVCRTLGGRICGVGDAMRPHNHAISSRRRPIPRALIETLHASSVWRTWDSSSRPPRVVLLR